MGGDPTLRSLAQSAMPVWGRLELRADLLSTFFRQDVQVICELLVSQLDHPRHRLEFEHSRHSTFRSPSGHYHHLDHLFATDDLCAKVVDYEIMPIDEAVRSDHAPILLTLK